MFTGIARERGTVRSVETIRGGLRLTIDAQESLRGLKLGDSIAVSGVCQTVVALGRSSFSVEALEETIRRSTIGNLRSGDMVNLEPALGPEGFLGGHLVSGHVDGVGHIQSRRQRAGDTLLQIRTGPHILAQVFERGSVAVDGISLTVTAVSGDGFSVALIPHTLENTTLAMKRAQDAVNLETDMIVKAVQRLLHPYLQTRGLTEERLRELGF
jgi:riboflavin synthase